MSLSFATLPRSIVVYGVLNCLWRLIELVHEWKRRRGIHFQIACRHLHFGNPFKLLVLSSGNASPISKSILQYNGGICDIIELSPGKLSTFRTTVLAWSCRKSF
jgi:hypothetical protein